MRGVTVTCPRPLRSTNILALVASSLSTLINHSRPQPSQAGETYDDNSSFSSSSSRTQPNKLPPPSAPVTAKDGVLSIPAGYLLIPARARAGPLDELPSYVAGPDRAGVWYRVWNLDWVRVLTEITVHLTIYAVFLAIGKYLKGKAKERTKQRQLLLRPSAAPYHPSTGRQRSPVSGISPLEDEDDIIDEDAIFDIHDTDEFAGLPAPLPFHPAPS